MNIIKKAKEEKIEVKEHIEDYREYQQLLLKRDLNKLVLDIRVYCQMMEAKNPEYMSNVYRYYEYVLRYGDFGPRIKELIERAKRFGINPNDLSAKDESLKSKIALIRKSASDEDKEKIDALNCELLALRNVLTPLTLPMNDSPKFLSTELIALFEGANSPLLDDQIGAFLKELYRYVEHEVNSREYIFVLGLEGENPWLDSCFKSYFIDRDLPLEDRQTDFERIYDAGYLELNDRVFASFKKYLDFYLSHGCKLSEVQFTSFIEDEKFTDSEISTLAAHQEAMPFDICTYIERLIGEKMGSAKLSHDIDSPFYLTKLTTSEDIKNFGIGIATILPKLIRLKGEDLTAEDVVAYLGSRAATLPYAYEVADIISNDLYIKSALAEDSGDLESYSYYESLKEAFDKGYIEGKNKMSSKDQLMMKPIDKN